MSAKSKPAVRSKKDRQASPPAKQAAATGYAFDEILLSQARLAIVSALLVPGRMEFVEMKTLLSMTAGNLSIHSAKLEAAGYIQIEKEFVGKNPRTTYILTSAGRRALVAHVEQLSRIVSGQR